MVEEKLAKRKQSEVTRREESTEYFKPAVDISETENEITLKFDMPGVDKNEVDISADKNTLTVVGNVSMECLGDVVYQETRTGNYRREFTLPEDIDHDSISAEMNAGVLTVKVAKPELARPKRIEIKSGS